MAAMLLDGGAVIDAEDNKHHTPVQRAVDIDPTCLPLVEFLRARGSRAEINWDCWREYR